jgi:hypothetical protein
MRSLANIVLLVALLGCKKKDPEPEPEPTPTTGARGHSVTKVSDEPTEHGSAQAGSAEAEADAGVDKNKPAYRDDHGEVHGPGGGVYGGRMPDCTPDRDHCLRDGVWFASGPYREGALFRATPVFEFEGKMWTWRGDEYPPSEYEWLFKTKAAKKEDIVVGEPIVWVIRGIGDNTDFLNSEKEALTSSRWDVGIVEKVESDFVRVSGWAGNVKIDTIRVITEKKKSS